MRPPEWDGPQRKGGRSSCCRPLGGPPVVAETILEGPISSRPPSRLQQQPLFWEMDLVMEQLS